jgi:leucyl/phenylalanyl-tRNA--protein transferase
MVAWLRSGRLPDPEAEANEDGLVALGGKLDPELLLRAYAAGIFPWSSDPVVTWWSPDPRAIFDIPTYKAHRSTRQSVRQNNWRLTTDERFVDVMRACAEETDERPSTWITDDFVAAYSELHRRGHAHSIEVYEGEELIGGLYGVTLGGFFGGESMFHRRSDASKAAVWHLVEHLRARGFVLCDGQVPTPHLHRIGAVEIPRSEYLRRLREAVRLPIRW